MRWYARRLHALTWAWWALACLLVIQAAPSPTYVALVIAIAALVVESHRSDGPLGRAFPILVSAAAVFALLRVALTALTTHPGGTVLVRLPELTLPMILSGFTVGGDVETAVLVRALAEGLVVVGVIAAFGAFNAIVSHHDLVRIVPRAFHEVGLVVTVALAFVPSTVAAVGAVREADRARTGGRVVRRGRIVRLLVPVLESGMERAMRLAESMDARGFAHGGASRPERRAGWLGLCALLALAAGFAALVGGQRAVAISGGMLGLVLLTAAVAVASRASARSRYRPPRPERADVVVAALIAVAPVGVVLVSVLGDAPTAWDLAQGLVPPFDIVVALPLLFLGIPALLPRAGVRSAPVTERVEVTS